MEKIFDYINNIDLLNNETLYELKEVSEKYPYFQTAHLLFVRNLKIVNQPGYEGYLRYVSACIANRRKLHNLIELPVAEINKQKLNEIQNSTENKTEADTELFNNISTKKRSEIKKTKNTIKRKFSTELKDNINATLVSQIEVSNEIENTDDEVEFLPETVFDIETEYSEKKNKDVESKKQGDFFSLDYSTKFVAEDEQELSSSFSINENDHNYLEIDDYDLLYLIDDDYTSTDQPEKEDLIDLFIKTSPSLEKGRIIQTETVDISTDSVTENDGFITDTLAHIYLKQGLYIKAKNTYEKLCLKYPEKSSYFTSQIEQIDKLIENLKT